MLEHISDLWDWDNRDNCVICITTNCDLKRNGDAVMGAGCAFEAVKRYPRLAGLLGRHIAQSGSLPIYLTNNIIAFPVKYHWWEKANLELIMASTTWLRATALSTPERTFLLPRPGCGKGRLRWADVRPRIIHLPDNVVIVSPPIPPVR